MNIINSQLDINLILLDIQLPELSGYYVANEVKKLTNPIPVIAQTAYATEEDKAKCIEAGCTDYIKKPIVASELMKLIMQHINAT